MIRAKSRGLPAECLKLKSLDLFSLLILRRLLTRYGRWAGALQHKHY